MAAPLRKNVRNESGIETAVAVLKQRFGPRCHTGEAMREQHGHTTTWLTNEPPDAVVFAHSTDDVVAIVETCRTHAVPIIAFGVGTSLEGHVNAPAGGISIDFSEMATVLEVHDEDLTCTVEPGVTRKKLNEHLRDRGLFFPIDPGADATIGGMAATRASGPTLCATAPCATTSSRWRRCWPTGASSPRPRGPKNPRRATTSRGS